MASHNRTTASEIGRKVIDIPTVPTIGTATAGPESATVAFTPATKGGSASTYTALSNPGSVTGSGASSPVTVSGLTAGTAYTFTVRGNNSTGSSEYSSASNSITALVGGSYESIATISVGAGGSSSIDFTSIPSTYTHLQIRYIGLTNRATYGIDDLNMRINSDTGGNYSSHRLYGNGASPSSDASTSASSMVGISYSGTTVSSYPGSAVIDILDYSNTNKYKTVKSISGIDVNGTIGGVPGYMFFVSGNWRNTSAITSISLYSGNGSTITQYSQFALYGIKGA
jgi:hypothetical protein